MTLVKHMNVFSFVRKVVHGVPYLGKELRDRVTDCTAFFIAKPWVVQLKRNAPCNGRCIMCSGGFLKGDAVKESNETPLSDEMIPRVLDQIAELGGRGTMVSYTGGEPLLTRALLDWADQAKKLKIDFRFTTNGYLVNEEVARLLVAADLFNIGVSLESLDTAVNEAIRPFRGGTVRTIKAIDLLLLERQQQRSRTSINIKCMLTRLNHEAFLEIVERWGKADGVIVTPQTLEVQDGMPLETQEKLWISDVSGFEKTVGQIKKLQASGYHINADDQALDNFIKRYRDDPERKSMLGHKTVVDNAAPVCNIGTESLFIGTDGAVKLCPHFPAIGNVVQNGATLMDMWHSKQAHLVRSQTKRCRQLCTLSNLRHKSLLHKIRMFIEM